MTRTVLLYDKIGYRFGTIVGLGVSKRGVFIRTDAGALTYAHNDTYGTFWWFKSVKPCIEIPLKYDLVKLRDMEKAQSKHMQFAKDYFNKLNMLDAQSKQATEQKLLKADYVVFLPMKHRCRALALRGSDVVAFQANDTGYWFENTINALQLDSHMFCKLPVAERKYDYVNFK